MKDDPNTCSFHKTRRLAEVARGLERILTVGDPGAPRLAISEIRCETVHVCMRDGVKLATDLYLPPSLPAPTIALRTPYGRDLDKYVGGFISLARRGYVVISQDCRGTGDSEPEAWNYYVHEQEDGLDFVDWLVKQDWFDGFLGAWGASYAAQTQWCMALHPGMSTIVPEVGGLGFAMNPAHLHMFCNAYARSVGKGDGKASVHYTEMERLILEETLAGGYYNEPLQPQIPEALLARYDHLRAMPIAEAKRWLWEEYCALTCAQRVEFIKHARNTDSVTILDIESLTTIFGHRISHDAHTVPSVHPSQLCAALHAPALMVTGWYDWGLNDALATWDLLIREARPRVANGSRLIITPSAHNMPGYHEGMETHYELQHSHRTFNNIALLLQWYDTVRDGTSEHWPNVIYYLMGANEWRVSASWPPSEVKQYVLYLAESSSLTTQLPQHTCATDRYVYVPDDPTPTVGGSIVSYVYLPGSVDVSGVQKRSDVLTYTTPPLDQDLDAVGPLRLILYASSSAVDTDFSARLSDVFPDGRAIQLQSGVLRARYRDLSAEPELLVPGQIYRLEIDMWATANRFKAGHCIRLDISSSDFPRFDRNSNRGGSIGAAVPALQAVYRDVEHPSHLIISVLGSGSCG